MFQACTEFVWGRLHRHTRRRNGERHAGQNRWLQNFVYPPSIMNCSPVA